MKTPLIASAALFTLSALCTTLVAANRTWDGEAGDGEFTTALNWSGNTVPANNDYGDTAVFNATVTAGTVNLSAGRSILGINFQSAGWTLTGSPFGNLTQLTSAGAGTNTLSMSFEQRYTGNWTVASGNTLVLANSFYQRSQNVTVDGGGTLQLASAITGFGGTVGSWGMNLGDITVRFDTATPYSSASAGAIFMNSADSRLQLLSSVSAAESLIGGRVRDGVGAGLLVTDIGGGYVEITSLAAIPEPSVAGLFAGLCGLAFVSGRRRRRR